MRAATPNEKLDSVLRCLVDSYQEQYKMPVPFEYSISEGGTYKSYSISFERKDLLPKLNIDLHVRFETGIDIIELDIILDFLVEERMIQKIDSNYRILYRGMSFLEDGGYVGRQNDLVRIRERDDNFQNLQLKKTKWDVDTMKPLYVITSLGLIFSALALIISLMTNLKTIIKLFF